MKNRSLSRFLISAVIYGTVSNAAAGLLTYDDFIRQVDAGHVVSVTINSDGNIAGTYRPSGRGVEPFEAIGSFGSPAQDPLLARLLASKGLTPSVAPASTSGKQMAAMTLAAAFPLLLLAWMLKIHSTLKSISKRLPPGPGW